MKRLTLVLFILGLAMSAVSQEALIERGDKLFDKFNYGEALYYYQDAFAEDSTSIYSVRHIGLCMRKLGMMEESGLWFLKAIDMGSDVPEDKLYYAESLKAQMKYSKSVFWYARYSADRPEDRRAQKHIRDTQYFRDLWADSLKYEIHRLEINSDKPSFGMCRFNGRYVFCSAGINNSFLEEDAFDEVPFLDVYACDLDEEGEAINPERLNGNVNSKYHDGPAFFDENYQVMYVTRNNMKGGRPVYDKSGTANLQIYAMRLQNGDWSKAEGLPFNSDDFSTGHPTLDIESTRMIFVSNMLGGYGGTDLYEVRYTKNGWTEPVNLGPAINTEGNEMFPFISDEGILYFSSDGHAGLGGLDIFVAEISDEGYSEPINLGYPINSSKDDFGIHYNEIEEMGYFSSNRNGQGSDNIYRFSTVRFMQQIVALNFETDENVLMAGKFVTLRSLTMEEDSVIRLDENGSFQALLDAGHSFEVFMGQGETMSSEPILSFEIDEELTETFVDLGTFKVSKQALIDAGLIEEVIELQLAIAEGDSLGAAEKGAEIRGLLERLRDETHFLSNTEFDELTSSELIDNSELDRLVLEQDEVVKAKNAELRQYELNNIYFGFDSYAIRRSEREKATALIEIMENDPNVNVVVKAHTDSRGDENYNLLLSMRRAKSIEKYLAKYGIDKSRFKIAWVGESELFIDCEGQPCSEADHALNRRVEVLFVAGDPTALEEE
ncbi:OmpA family protein [Sanyastnella coralliicola]|uniref:OmpA family protein n=1 Tax=Sanyastnella coralliicola TaxID=3069118 RepID=UPI0027BA355B|nr:OmpA family protein [Longitalea sp. SCSIO 12813]